MEKTTDYTKPEYFENRELSWIKFNRRVLNEARDKTIPLLERLKFVSITSSNLDEFFMVRVASLKDMLHAGVKKADIAGMDALKQLERVNEDTRELVNLQYSTYNRSLLPLMNQENIYIIDAYEKLTQEQAAFVDDYFENEVYPVLTPMAVDASRPFPLIRNRSLNIAAVIEYKGTGGLLGHKSADAQSEDTDAKADGQEPDSGTQAAAKEDAGKEKSSKKKDKKAKKGAKPEFATVQVPSGMARLVPVPSKNPEEKVFILLEQVIEKNIDKLFLNYKVLCAYPYRIMRNADFSIDEDEAPDLLKEIQKQLKKRQWGEVIRLEVEDGIDKKLLEFLKDELHIENKQDIFYINGPIDFTFLMKMYGLPGCDHLRYEPHKPQLVPEIMPGENIFEAIQKGDILLHHPYQTFGPVMELIRQAANDEQVLAIKMTLYRVSGNSPIIASLAQAAENGKQVTVLVELKARFDEENNIVWAKKLEQAGCHVIYGIVGLKTHSKIALVVRREDEGIRRYVHLGTGNYNDSTAKLYTDCGVLTCSEAIGEDATAVFNMLSGYSEPLSWNSLAVAPIWLRKKFLKLVHRETRNAREGKQAYIRAKMNSLCDQEMIEALYEASSAGVKIQLLIRGICCLRAGIPNVSENIQVHSIVGNFLEHSRIFDFCNDGHAEVYMGSADWMPRNLDRRVEIVFPVLDEELKKKVLHILDVEFEDNVKAHVLQQDGTYEKIDKRGKVLVNSQEIFCKEAESLVPKEDKAYQKRVFVPAEPVG
ncbi:MAG: RNA degradosome polyphosphate kinase [Eubacterium sp.]|nr:RNA degradosome polyphosphate kinase [Eubacterium sp.]